MLEAALYYAGIGLPVFPLAPNMKIPKIAIEDGGHGVLDATCDKAQIREWWNKWPDCNIGGATGFKFDVLDVDEGGEETLTAHEPIPQTPEVTTASGGTHLYLKVSPIPLKNVVKFAPGLDVRTKGGYVVLPPSVNGKAGWKWKVKLTDAELSPWPQWIVEVLRDDAPKEKLQVGAEVPKGERNRTMFRLGSLARRMNATAAEIETILTVFNQRCSPPLSQRDVQKIAVSASSYAPHPNFANVDSGEPQVPEPEHARSGPIGAFATTGVKRGCASGFNLIDDNTETQGFPEKQVSVVTAYTGMGKSAFLLQAALNVSRRNQAVCFATFADLSAEDLYDRLVKVICGWNGSRSPTMSEAKQGEWQVARKEVEGLPLYVYDASELRRGRDIETFADWLKRYADDFRLVCVDYAQELRTSDRKIAGMMEQAEQVSVTLRWLASDTLLPIVIGSQVTEGSEKMGTRDITKGSRVWEERCGLLLNLKRLDENESQKLEGAYRGMENLVQAHLVKNRFGKSHLKTFWQWNDSHVRFDEL